MESRFSEPVDFPVIVKVANLLAIFKPISVPRISGSKIETLLYYDEYPIQCLLITIIKWCSLEDFRRYPTVSVSNIDKCFRKIFTQYISNMHALHVVRMFFFFRINIVFYV